MGLGAPGSGHARGRLNITAALAVVLLTTLCLPGCGPSNGGSGDGFTLTVPVLWAGGQADGKTTGGIEPAGVWAGQDATPGYSVDLNGLEANGAGPAWRAATGAAAAVGTLFSAVDPTHVGLRFSITGSIDGPSGGAALTVGVIAALRHQQLRPKVTMTGTIAPDGSVGRVSGVPTKIAAAADAGYTTVLIPIGNSTSSSAATHPGSPANLTELGKSLGVRVLAVSSISAAYREFTGTEIAPPITAPPSLRPAVAKAADTQTALLLRLATRALAKSRNALPAGLSTRLSVALAAANRAKSAGDWATAYAVASDAYRQLARADRASAIARAIQVGGVARAKQVVQAEASSLIQTANAALVRASDVAGLGVYQQLSVPMAISSISTAIAVLQTVGAALASEDGGVPKKLILAGGIVAQQRSAVEVFEPADLSIVRAATSVPGPGEGAVVTFMSGYTNFLVNAGKANETYGETVLGGLTPSQTTPSVDLPTTLEALGRTATAIPRDEQHLSAEVTQFTNALTYFVLSTAIVSSSQGLGIHGFGIGADPTISGDSGPVRNAIATAKLTVDGYGAALAGKSVDAGAPIWSADWGTKAAQVTAGSSREAAGAVTALTQLWFATANVLVLQAGVTRFSH